MFRFVVLILTLSISSSVYADYVGFFTQLDIQPELGRISITRGSAREPKYVDWMHDNREELARKNIFVDARWNTEHGYLRVVEMDGHTIMIAIESNHFRRSGPGTATADNHIRINIDGKIRCDIMIGSDYGLETVEHIELLPLGGMLSVRGKVSRSCDEGCGRYATEEMFMYIFYEDENLDPEGCITTRTFFDVPKPKKPNNDIIYEDSALIDV